MRDIVQPLPFLPLVPLTLIVFFPVTRLSGLPSENSISITIPGTMNKLQDARIYTPDSLYSTTTPSLHIRPAPPA